MSVILEAHDLVKRHPLGEREMEALSGVSLAVERGEFLAIMGSSGSGKSTLLHLLGGLDLPTSGEVVIDGVRISTLDDEHRTLTRRAKTGFVFQFFNLIPLLSVAENIALPFLIAGDTASRHRSRIDELLAMVGLAERVTHRPTEMSGGEQQRVAIARAIVGGPAIVLADEPTGNLDSDNGARILDLLVEFNRETGVTTLLATHAGEIAAAAHRIVRMRDGRIEPDAERPTGAPV